MVGQEWAFLADGYGFSPSQLKLTFLEHVRKRGALGAPFLARHKTYQYLVVLVADRCGHPIIAGLQLPELEAPVAPGREFCQRCNQLAAIGARRKEPNADVLK